MAREHARRLQGGVLSTMPAAMPVRRWDWSGVVRSTQEPPSQGKAGGAGGGARAHSAPGASPPEALRDDRNSRAPWSSMAEQDGDELQAEAVDGGQGPGSSIEELYDQGWTKDALRGECRRVGAAGIGTSNKALTRYGSGMHGDDHIRWSAFELSYHCVRRHNIQCLHAAGTTATYAIITHTINSNQPYDQAFKVWLTETPRSTRNRHRYT